MLRFTSSKLISKVTIFGSGTMGGGIAQVTAAAGIPVTLVDVNDTVLGKNKDVIAKSLARVAKKKLEAEGTAAQKAFVDKILANISTSSNAAQAVADTDLVIEAIVEKMDAKVGLWKSIDGAAKPSTIFASNTSSLSITEQAQQGVAAARHPNFAGLHFFSPVPMMKLVEIVKTEQTSPATIEALQAYSKKIGKTSVVAKDTKGFIVNRLLIPLMAEAARLVERGVCTPEDVDVAMRLGAGHPMGPFQLMDSVGLDVVKLIQDGWNAAEPENELFKPLPIVNAKVSEGKMGRKSGEGFYKY
jgi:3-hydroxyacyl-CoA dehydrogenase